MAETSASGPVFGRATSLPAGCWTQRVGPRRKLGTGGVFT